MSASPINQRGRKHQRSVSPATYIRPQPVARSSWTTLATVHSLYRPSGTVHSASSRASLPKVCAGKARPNNRRVLYLWARKLGMAESIHTFNPTELQLAQGPGAEIHTGQSNMRIQIMEPWRATPPCLERTKRSRHLP